MSYTIVRDQHQAQLDLQNVVNQIKRHCRIGKVTRKPVVTLGWFSTSLATDVGLMHRLMAGTGE